MTLTAAALTNWPTIASELVAGGPTVTTSRQAIERMIMAVSSAMSTAALGRRFEFTAGIEERLPAAGQQTLVLGRWPVKAIRSIVLLNPDGSIGFTFDATGYQLDAEAGLVYRTAGAYWGSTAPVGNSTTVADWSGRPGWPLVAQPNEDIRGSAQVGTERPAIQVVYDAGFYTPQQDLAADGETSMGIRDLPADLEEACIIAVASMWARRGRSRDVLSESKDNVSVSWRDGAGLLPPEAIATAKSYARVL